MGQAELTARSGNLCPRGSAKWGQHPPPPPGWGGRQTVAAGRQLPARARYRKQKEADNQKTLFPEQTPTLAKVM